MEDQQAIDIIDAYLELKNLQFTGVYERDETIPRTNTIRRVIRVISPEVIEILTRIRGMDNDHPTEVIWKAITSSDTDGTQLWCTASSTVGDTGVEQRYKIIQALPGYLEPRKDNTYMCLINVRVHRVQ